MEHPAPREIRHAIEGALNAENARRLASDEAPIDMAVRQIVADAIRAACAEHDRRNDK